MKTNWQIKKLGEVCNVFTDGNWIESKDQSTDGIRLIQTGNIGQGYFKDRGEKARYISEKTFKRLNCREIFENDVLVSRLPDPVGRACIIPNTGEKMITAVDCSILRFNNNIISSFFNYFSQSNNYLTNVEALTSGTTRKRISRNNLGLIEIPIPPLSEQHRIVKILNKVFGEIEKAKENTEKNLNNSKELFESYLQNIDAKKESLGSIVDITTGKLNSNEAVKNGEYPFFTCSREIFSIDKYAFNCEAILLAGNNASGDFNVKHYKGRFNAYQRTYVITVNKENKILYRYLYFQLLNSLKEFKSKSVGVGTKFLKLGMIKDLQIPLLSIDEQKSIVKKLDLLSEKTKRLEEIYKQKLADLEELKKSILKKAFDGEL